MKSRLFLLLLVFFSSLAFAETYYSLGSDKETLGRGFSSTLSMPLSTCLTGDWVSHGGVKGDLVYRQSMDDRTAISSVTGSVKGSVNLIIFGGSAKFSIRKKVTENNNSVASTLQLDYVDDTYTLENRRVTDEIAALLTSNPGQVASRCGDSFIHSQTKGSNLYVTAKLHFRSKEEYEWYQTKIKIRVLFVKKTITKTKEFRNAIKNAVYSVTVSSDGGLTPHLNAMGTSKHCRGTNIDACVDYADALFAYLFSGGGYSNDLQALDLQPIKFTTESYAASGHFPLIPPSADNLPADYVRISGRLRGYQDLVNDEIERVTAFLSVATDAERPALQHTFDLRQAESQALSEAGEHCATLPGVVSCEQRVEAAIAQVH